MAKAQILVAEDEIAVRDMCLVWLRRAGYDAVGVSNGEQAVKRARSQQFDLMVTDLKMPRMGGLEACRAIREFNPDLAMVVMTGFGTMESAIEALKSGVSEFVLKPCRPDQLRAAVERALSKQQLERENARLNTLIPLFDLSRIFMSSVDPALVSRHVVRIAREETGAEGAVIMLFGEDGELAIDAVEGSAPNVIAGTQQVVDEAIARYVLPRREPVVLYGDLGKDPRFGPVRGNKQVTNAVILPLVHQERSLGLLYVSRLDDAPRFTQADVDFLSVLGSQAATAIENARLFQEAQDAYERLEELDHLKSEFISIASHELRAPLAVLLAYASLLEQDATGPMREHLARVVDSAMQLKSIIDEMVSLRRIDAREAQVTIADLSIADAVESALKDLRPLADSKHLHVVASLRTDLPPVRADDQVLALILSNLLSNAIKFTPERGTIRVSASVEEGRLVTAVSDTGVGIPEEDLERIFQRFYQVEDSLRREHGGIGLGLAIAREMADLVDGRIWAESKVGQGSTFYLSLPSAE